MSLGARILLGLSTLVWLPYGLFCLVQPSYLAEAAGVAATTPTGTAEIRAMYGGLQAAIGALCLLGCLRAAWHRPALVCLLFLATGLALARLIGVAAGADLSGYTIGALIFEITSAGFALWFVRKVAP